VAADGNSRADPGRGEMTGGPSQPASTSPGARQEQGPPEARLFCGRGEGEQQGFSRQLTVAGPTDLSVVWFPSGTLSALA